MISGLDLNATVDYVLKDDKENPTVWKLGVIPSYLFARISEGGGIDTVYKVLQLALKGWDNFSVPFETKTEKVFGKDLQVVPMETLGRIPLKIVTELSLKVMEVNQLSEPERKN